MFVLLEIILFSNYHTAWWLFLPARSFIIVVIILIRWSNELLDGEERRKKDGLMSADVMHE
jgi:hypothetical protein